MPIFCFYHTATIIFYLPILGNQNLHPAYFIFRLEHFFPFCHFCSNPLASRCLPVGVFLPLFTLLLQHACFSMASGWSFSSHFVTFAPTCLLLDVFRLERPSLFLLFYSNPLASRYLPVGAFLPIFPLLLQPACFSMASGWSFPSHCANFPQPACKLACSDACAWLVAPDNPAGFRLHITGTSSPLRSDSVSVIPQIHAFACKLACSDACAWGIITQKSPRAMWSSAGLLEKGVDYKFHVREFMFRCS